MSQITLYLDEETDRRMRKAAEDAGLSISRWVANLVQEKTSDEWPVSVAELAGAWSDFPSLDEIRGSLAEDSERDEL